MPHDFIGWTHTIFAIIALIAGSLVLNRVKGTALHKMTGKIYVVSMLIVCVTAFTIYRVHRTFGILHVFAVVSTITLFLGMLPMYIKGYKNPIVAHLAWMYWSVIGLYCAFTAEIFTRIPILLNIENNYGIFYGLVFLSAGLVGMIGSRYFKTKKKIWEAQFGS
ncbi:MAG: DUF2306 domain-containing protein [Winogradskyella sp.]|uniref:DUF2306 domain-containing protein n=1 Tax=Winogradskyella sp. TaxID=1883156 RepID=UPI001818574F|nr:DUF2306 domain-containing protein [Winogradskyella sp.]